EHVAIHEDRPAFEAAEIGREEAREGEVARLQRAALAAIHALELREHERRDRDRLGSPRLDRVGENAEGDRLARVEADEDADHAAPGTQRVIWSSTPQGPCRVPAALPRRFS